MKEVIAAALLNQQAGTMFEGFLYFVRVADVQNPPADQSFHGGKE
jgi:hypothetical protein